MFSVAEGVDEVCDVGVVLDSHQVESQRVGCYGEFAVGPISVVGCKEKPNVRSCTE
jgi:hypothetical protein